MTKKIAVIISPNWGDYGQKYIRELYVSLKNQDYKDGLQIYIADNESSAESYDFLKKEMPEAIIIRNKNNDGYAKGCNDALKEAMKEDFTYLMVVNIHNVLEKDCLSQMLKVLDSDKNIGAVQARLMLHPPELEKISSLGNETHFLGFGYCRGYNEKYKEENNDNQEIFYPSGSSIVMRTETWKKIGLFDEVLWMYNEDQELGWRIWLNGLKCVLAAKAIQYNKYDFSRSIKKFYWMDRNRIIVMLKCYRLPTLLLIFPAFIIMEFGLVLFSLKNGWFKEKKEVWRYFFNKKNWRYILRGRREIQKNRQVSDRQISKMISGKIWYQEVDDYKLRLINPVFNLYWRVVRFFIFW